MSDVTRILSKIDQRDPAAANELLPLVYESCGNFQQPGCHTRTRAILCRPPLWSTTLISALSTPRPSRVGTRAGVSSRPLPRRCDGFWLSPPGANPGRSMAGIISGENSWRRRFPCPSRPMNSSRCTSLWRNWRARIPRRPSWLSCGVLPVSRFPRPRRACRSRLERQTRFGLTLVPGLPLRSPEEVRREFREKRVRDLERNVALGPTRLPPTGRQMNEQEIFTEALERDAAERKAYLDGACRDSPVLRKRSRNFSPHMKVLRTSCSVVKMLSRQH